MDKETNHVTPTEEENTPFDGQEKQIKNPYCMIKTCGKLLMDVMRFKIIIVNIALHNVHS